MNAERAEREPVVYRNELSKLGHGYPLYEPDPKGEYDKVRIGDVGYVDRFGCFHTVFNVFLSPEHPANQRSGTPEDFSPLDASASHSFSRNDLPAGAMSSTYVRSLGCDLDISGPCILANSSVKFEMSGRRGAALVIKYPAFREDSSRERRLASYILQNYRSWFTFIHDVLGCQVTLGDIVLVTGCDLTADWTTATFVEKSSQFKFEFKVGDPAMLASSSAAAWGTWQSSVNVPSRCGPSRLRQQTEMPVLSRDGTLQSLNHAIERLPPMNQCIFLRGFRVRERAWRGPLIICAAADPKDLNMDRDRDAAPVITTLEDDIGSDGYESDTSTRRHGPEDYLSHNMQEPTLHDRLLELILEETDADVALIHDRDVCQIIKAIEGDPRNASRKDIMKAGREFKTYLDAESSIKFGTIEASNFEDPNENAELPSLPLLHRPWHEYMFSPRLPNQRVGGVADGEFPASSSVPSSAAGVHYPPSTLAQPHIATTQCSAASLRSSYGPPPHSCSHSNHSPMSAHPRSPTRPRAPSHKTSDIGNWMTFATGPFMGRTIRAEVEEVQKADLGRKCAEPPTFEACAGARESNARGKTKRDSASQDSDSVYGDNVEKKKGKESEKEIRSMKKDRRPLDPPPVISLRLFESLDHGTPAQNEVLLPADEVEIGGLICQVDLYRVLLPMSASEVELLGGGALPVGMMGGYTHPNPVLSHHQGGFSHRRGGGDSEVTESPTTAGGGGAGGSGGSGGGGEEWESSMSHSSPISPYRGAAYHTHSTSHGHSYPIQPTIASPSSHLSPMVIYPDFLSPPQESDKLTHALFGETYAHANSILDLQGQPAIYFVFGDLSVKLEGLFRLRYRFFDLHSRMEGCSDVPVLAQCFGGAFAVYSSKEFPGLKVSTPLTKHLTQWGIRVTIRLTERKRRAPEGGSAGVGKGKGKRKGKGKGKGKGKRGANNERVRRASKGGSVSSIRGNQDAGGKVIPRGADTSKRYLKGAGRCEGAAKGRTSARVSGESETGSSSSEETARGGSGKGRKKE